MKRKPNRYWTADRIKNEAVKFSSRTAFARGNCAAYSAAQRLGIIDFVCKNVPQLVKPRGYWTFDKVQDAAAGYASRKAFERGNCAAYNAGRRLGIIDIVCKDMPQLVKPKGYWTIKRCKLAATKYSSRSEFRRKDSTAYEVLRKMGILDLVCKNMPRLIKPNGYWTLARCKKTASHYSSRSEFQKKDGVAYNVIRKMGMLDLVCKDMPRLHKPTGYWTLEKCIEAATCYSYRGEFQEKRPDAYAAAQRLKILDIVCRDMRLRGNLYKRAIYAFEFSDSHAYIGLTCDLDRRYQSHMCGRSPVFNYIKEYPNLSFEFKKLSEYVDKQTAVKLEAQAIKDYRKRGYTLLNQAKPGGLGGNVLKWDKESCKREAMKYKYREEFRRGASGAYDACRRNKWFDEFFPKKWDTLEKVQAVALKYETRSKFRKKAKGAYAAALRNNWMNILFPKQ